MSFQLKVYMFVKCWVFSVWFMYVWCFKDSSDRVLESDKLSPSPNGRFQCWKECSALGNLKYFGMEMCICILSVVFL